MLQRAIVYVSSAKTSLPQDCDVYWHTTLPAEANDDRPPSPCRLSTWTQSRWDELAEIDCIFPSEWVTTLAVTLPSSRKRVLQAALPYAVEEFLIQPIEDYHIVHVSTEIDGSIGVAVIENALMDTWCSWIDQHFPRKKTRFLVDGWLLPHESGDITTLRVEDRVLTRYGNRLCIATPSTMLNEVMDALRATFPDIGKEHTSPLQWAGDMLDGASHIAKNVMSHVEHFTGPDLRQGRYKSQTTIDWRWSAGLLAAGLLVSSLIMTAGNYYRASVYTSQRLETQAATETLYRQTFVTQGQLVNMPVQARQQVNNMKAQWHPIEERPEFFPLFYAVAEAVAEWGKEYTYTLRQLAFVERDSSLNMEIMTSDMGHLNNLQKFLSDRGLHATVLSATADEGQFVGRISVTSDAE